MVFAEGCCEVLCAIRCTTVQSYASELWLCKNKSEVWEFEVCLWF